MSQVAQTITAQYVRRDEDWIVTVSGLGKTLNGEASGLIAARDRADQLVEQIAPEGTQPTVVHLLNGSAYEFTSAYMTARLYHSNEDKTAEEAEGTDKQAHAEASRTQAADTAGTEAPADEAGQQSRADQAYQAQQEQGDRENPTDQGNLVTAEAQEGQEGTAPAVTPTVPRKELSRSPEEAARHDYAHVG